MRSNAKIDIMSQKAKMKPMSLLRHSFAYVTLGLLCGWYYFLMLLYPTLIVCIFCDILRLVCIGVLTLLIALTFTPLTYKPWKAFMYSWVFDVWSEYFDFTTDMELFHKDMKDGEQYMFTEFPHGIFPLGQVVSTCVIDEVTPGKMICGTGASVVFSIPVMRQFMSWLGTRPVNRRSISKIFKDGHHMAIIPGGIAEMYLVSDTAEGIYLKKRQNTVKAAIVEGVHIVPTFFFGNSLVLKMHGQGKGSWIAEMSRKLRTSIMLFYGRHLLPVPIRHPIRMVLGNIIRVKQNDNPSEQEVQAVLDQLEAAVAKLYKDKKPDWETRPLVIH